MKRGGLPASRGRDTECVWFVDGYCKGSHLRQADASGQVDDKTTVSTCVWWWYYLRQMRRYKKGYCQSLMEIFKIEAAVPAQYSTLNAYKFTVESEFLGNNGDLEKWGGRGGY